MGTRKCKILLVDDSESDRALFRIALERARIPGVELIREAEDGQEAIQYLQTTASSTTPGPHLYPDLLVLDLKMPGNDGFDVLKWLEDRGVRPVVVVLSESGSDTDIEQALALGVDKYLQKPDGLPRLIDFIREFCSR